RLSGYPVLAGVASIFAIGSRNAVWFIYRGLVVRHRFRMQFRQRQHSEHLLFRRSGEGGSKATGLTVISNRDLPQLVIYPRRQYALCQQPRGEGGRQDGDRTTNARGAFLSPWYPRRSGLQRHRSLWSDWRDLPPAGLLDTYRPVVCASGAGSWRRRWSSV